MFTSVSASKSLFFSLFFFSSISRVFHPHSELKFGLYEKFYSKSVVSWKFFYIILRFIYNLKLKIEEKFNRLSMETCTKKQKAVSDVFRLLFVSIAKLKGLKNFQDTIFCVKFTVKFKSELRMRLQNNVK